MLAPRMRLVALCVGLLAACGPKQPLSSTPTSHRYRLELDLRTEVTAPDAPAALVEALEAHGSVDERHALTLEVSRSRRFRDGSEGLLIHITEADVMPAGGSSQRSGLAGRALELRRFGDGEILQMGPVAPLAGGDRQGEVLDLIFPLLSPSPPDLRSGQTAQRVARWPFRLAGDVGQRGMVELNWHYEDTAELDGIGTHHLTYEGPWETLGSDRASDWPRGMRALGEAEGEVWLGRADLMVQQHRFSWTRSVVIRGPRLGEQSRREVYQEQEFVGVLRRLP